MRKLIIGCGYLGRRVADLWRSEGHDVTVLTRSIERAGQLASEGFACVVGDVLDPASLRWLPAAETVLLAVGFDRAGPHSKRAVYVNGLQNVLTEVAPRCCRSIYVSSTSVYGQTDGSFVDEASPTEPIEESGRICLEAEQTFWQVADRLAYVAESLRDSGGIVLRLAGIYGPGRLLTRIDQLRSGTPLSGNSEAWLNLIHVDDAARVVLAAEQRGIAGATYLVCDDQPLQRRDYYAALANRAGAPPVRFVNLAGDAPERRSLNKRCVNRRLRETLQVELQFPTVIDGLKSLPELSR